MNRLWSALGRVAFWLSYPALFVYLRIGSRTRVLIIVDNSVLVVRGWLGAGHWGLPGGGLHRGEDPKAGAIRETKEETGITLKPEQLQFLYRDRANYKGLRFNFACYAVRLDKRPQVEKQRGEITEIAWLPIEAITAKNATDDTCQTIQRWLKP